MINLLGINSSIAKNFYIKLKQQNQSVTCMNHNDLDELSNISADDILINFCGISRGTSYDDFENPNFIFVKNIVNKLNNIFPYVVHVSSLMVYGFKGKTTEEL